MVLIQHNDSMSKNNKVTEIRKTYARIIGDRLEDSVAKFGAILAQGIIDAGTRYSIYVMYMHTYMYKKKKNICNVHTVHGCLLLGIP